MFGAKEIQRLKENLEEKQKKEVGVFVFVEILCKIKKRMSKSLKTLIKIKLNRLTRCHILLDFIKMALTVVWFLVFDAIIL